jgi:hypothetical protein
MNFVLDCDIRVSRRISIVYLITFYTEVRLRFNLLLAIYHNFICTSPELKNEIHKAINDGKQRFQIMMFFTGMATDNDNSFDYTYYEDANTSLYITYTP